MIELEYDGEYGLVVLNLASKKIVCPNCKGEGAHLCESLRHEVITQEEMSEWDEESQEQYFQSGLQSTKPGATPQPKSRYDVVCDTCKGNRVIDAVDVESLDPQERLDYSEYLASEKLQASAEKEWEREIARGA